MAYRIRLYSLLCNRTCERLAVAATVLHIVRVSMPIDVRRVCIARISVSAWFRFYEFQIHSEFLINTRLRRSNKSDELNIIDFNFIRSVSNTICIRFHSVHSVIISISSLTTSFCSIPANRSRSYYAKFTTSNFHFRCFSFCLVSIQFCLSIEQFYDLLIFST